MFLMFISIKWTLYSNMVGKLLVAYINGVYKSYIIILQHIQGRKESEHVS